MHPAGCQSDEVPTDVGCCVCEERGWTLRASGLEVLVVEVEGGGVSQRLCGPAVPQPTYYLRGARRHATRSDVPRAREVGRHSLLLGATHVAWVRALSTTQ